MHCLTKTEIESLILSQELVSGHRANFLTPLGLDICASTTFFREDSAFRGSARLKQENAVAVVRHELQNASHYLEIAPGEKVFVFSQEYFQLPSRVRGRCYSTGSMALCGLEIVGDVLLHPGWKGHLLLPLRNSNQYHTIHLYPEDCVGQVQFNTVNDQYYDYNGLLQNLGRTSV